MVSPAAISTFYHLTLKTETEGYERDPTPGMVEDDRAQGPCFGAIVTKLDPESWLLNFPRATPIQVWQAQHAFQTTVKGMYPMTWTSPEGVEEVVVFADGGLSFSKAGGRLFQMQVRLERWHG